MKKNVTMSEHSTRKTISESKHEECIVVTREGEQEEDAHAIFGKFLLSFQ
jgi:hypothetical protein